MALYNYESESEVKELYADLGKYDTDLCRINGQLTIVQGSPLAFDDQLETYITSKIAEHYGNYDEAMDVAKEITAGFYEVFGLKEVYITEEY